MASYAPNVYRAARDEQEFQHYSDGHGSTKCVPTCGTIATKSSLKWMCYRSDIGWYDPEPGRQRTDTLSAKSPRLVGFTGYATCGKDTAAKCLIERGWVRVGFADALREALLALDPIIAFEAQTGRAMRLKWLVEMVGWDHAKKDREVRLLLQRMGTEAGRDIHGEMCWTDIAAEKIWAAQEDDKSVVITDCRFANEAFNIRSFGGIVVRIDRPGVEPANGHVSDALDGIKPDRVIVNDGTIEELHAKVLALTGEA
jgi:hypothetical protein